MPIPPDTRAPGDDHHVDDHNAIADVLTALTAADTLAAQKSANLSDLNSASAARTSLGLGTAAVQPASAFADVFSPLAYGAAGNGTTDDTTAVLAAFAAAAAAGGTVGLGTYLFKTTSPIPLGSNIKVKGNSPRGASGTKGGLANSATTLFTVTGSVENVAFENCSLHAGGGHVFDFTTGAIASWWVFLGLLATTTATGSAIWNMPDGQVYEFLADQNCEFQAAPGTVPAFNMISSISALRGIAFRRVRAVGSTSCTAPFFLIQGQAAAAYNTDVTFDGITAETMPNGIIAAYGVAKFKAENVKLWDTATITGDLFHIGAAPAGTGPGGANSHGVIIRNSGRASGAFSGSFYDVSAVTGTTDITLENVGLDYSSGSYNLPANGVAVVIGGAGGRGTVSTAILGVLANGGPNGVTGAGRFCGSITTGPPTASTAGSAVGASLVSDFILDQTTGGIWVCTAAGTPGTWVQSATSTSFAAVQDPLRIGQTQTFMPTAAPSANQTISANTGWFTRLLSGGYTISHIAVAIGASSGNICVAAYQSSGAGTSAVPATQLQTSGSIPCPAVGYTPVALGGSCTPNGNDWFAIGADNGTVTAAATGFSYNANQSLAQGGSYTEASLAGAVLPAPAGTLTASAQRMFFLRGTP